MTPQTQKSYIKHAAYFYRTRLANQGLSTSAILRALTAAAPDYRPCSFRKLKNAIAFDVHARGYPAAADKIRKLVNPTTAPGSTVKPKAKSLTVTSVSEDDFLSLLRHLQAGGCNDEIAALTIAWFLGVRPCEMRSIEVIDGRFNITGAKQSHDGKRGANRVLEIKDPGISRTVEDALLILKNSSRSIGAIRDCFRKECRKLWPRRKRHPTLKSLRHQFSSNLKSSGADAREIAYMMGHQSTRSIERYGDPRKGHSGGLSLLVEAADAEVDRIRTPRKSKAPWRPVEPCPNRLVSRSMPNFSKNQTLQTS
jgi:integrase